MILFLLVPIVVPGDEVAKVTQVTRWSKQFRRNMAPQIVLISGCSSGMGLATAVFLAKDDEKRFKVYATMRNLAKKGQLEEEGKDCLGDTLIIKQIDVCSDESVEKAVKEVLDTEGRIDVLCEYLKHTYQNLVTKCCTINHFVNEIFKFSYE